MEKPKSKWRTDINAKVYKYIHIGIAFLAWPFEPSVYVVDEKIRYYSPRYKKWVTVPKGFRCDGATWAPNIGQSWIVHDWLFACGCFDDSTSVLWRQANRIMQDIMEEEKQPRFLIKIYRKGVTSKWSLKAWKKHRKK